jgi:hypothetical protein
VSSEAKIQSIIPPHLRSRGRPNKFLKYIVDSQRQGVLFQVNGRYVENGRISEADAATLRKQGYTLFPYKWRELTPKPVHEDEDIMRVARNHRRMRAFLGEIRKLVGPGNADPIEHDPTRFN